MGPSEDWGYAVMDDGSMVPLQPPTGWIPEEEREYLNDSHTLWTRKGN